MAVLFAALARGTSDVPSLEAVKAALPSGIVQANAARDGAAVLYSIKYGSASDNAPLIDSGYLVEVTGLLADSRKRELITDLTGRYAEGGVQLSDYPTQFCALGIGHNQILGLVGAPGTDQLFTYEDEDFVVVTNRHNLIALVIPERKAKIRRDALILTMVQDHIRDFGTAVDGVMRTVPGSVIRGSMQGVRHHGPADQDWQVGLDHRDLIARVEELANEYSSTLCRYERIELGISGGKDSRAILGLLIAGRDLSSKLRLFTGGEPYAPDVMSAQDVVAAAGLSDQHTISPPSFSLKERFGDSMSWDLWVDASGASHMDLRQPPGRNLGPTGLRVGGHEIGFKQPPNELDLEPYLESRVKPWLRHPLVKKGTCDHLAESFMIRTRDVLKPAPMHRYNAVDLAMNHITLLTSSLQTVSHLGNFEVHPLLDMRFLELLVGTTDELVAAQFIHYVLMRRAQCPLEIPAFANDEWPAGLAAIADMAGMSFRGTPKPPYRFLQNFPSQSGYGRHAWRFRLFGLYIPWIREYIHSSQSRLDFLDLENIDALLVRDHSSWNFRDMARVGALLKICLTDHFGIRAWHLQNRKSIEDEINALAARGSDLKIYSALVPTADEAKAKTEAALAETVRLLRAAEEERDALKKARSGRKKKSAPKTRWQLFKEFRRKAFPLG